MKINFAQSSSHFRGKIKTEENKRKPEVDRKAEPQGNNIPLADNLPEIFTQVFKVICIYH